MAIEWPKEWDDGIEDDWPVTNGGSTGLRTEPRLWSAFERVVRSQGVRFAHRVERLGGPVAPKIDHTIEEAKAEVLAYHKEHGTRPTEKVGPEWALWDSWLRRQRSSLSQLCDELGLPGGLRLNRTLNEAKATALSYYEAHGTRPDQRTSYEWAGWNDWLRRQGSSLHQLCDELGLPGGRRMNRTLDEAKTAVLAYWRTTGRNPTRRSNPEWGQWNDWLRTRGSSLRQLCDELGLPRHRRAA